MRAFLDKAAKRKLLNIIPVLLPGCPTEPQLPLLLRGFTWVDCSHGKEEEGFELLIWGITGKKPVNLNDFAHTTSSDVSALTDLIPPAPAGSRTHQRSRLTLWLIPSILLLGLGLGLGL